MLYNKNAGWGRVQMAGLPFTGSGKLFAVGDSGTANRSMLTELFDVDPDGDVRFFSTIDAAIGECTADAGDIIYVMPGHTETVASAGAITADVAGVSIVGLGVGDDRPTITFSTDNTASFLVSADSVYIKGIIGVAGKDGLTSAFNVTGDDCHIDIEWRDGSATVEAATAVRLDTANNCGLDLVYKGFTGGNAVVAAVKLDDCDNVRINIDAYGVNSVAWVNMVDVASTNVVVTGKMYTHAITDYTQNVVDTITGSTWFTVIDDASAGSRCSGGSAQAIAGDDVGAVSAAIAVIDGYHDVPTADATDNTVVRDVVGNKTDAAAAGAVSTTESLMAYAKQTVTAGIARDTAIGDIQTDLGDPSTRTNFQSIESMIGVPDEASASLDDILRSGYSSNAIGPNNNGSLMEQTKYLMTLSPQVATKTISNMTGWDDAAVFSVTGDVLVRVIGVVGTTAILSTSGTTTMSVGTTEDPDAILPATTIDNSDFAATDVWTDANPEDDASPISTTSWVALGGGADIVLSRSVDDITQGVLTLYCEYKRLSNNGGVEPTI